MKKTDKIKYSLSDHYDGKVFFNPGKEPHKSFKAVFKFFLEKNQGKWPKYVENKVQPQLAENLPSDKTHITYINHASHLIQLQALNIITDPIFSKRAGPGFLLGPERVREPGIALQALPKIDVVVISHNHYDHMCIESLKKLKELFDPLFIVPLGNQKYLNCEKINKVIELDWWQVHLLNETQSITLVPSIHWSMRTILDRNKALWGGYWIKSAALNIYFAGDTGYDKKHFQTIRQRLGIPNISLLPVGAYEPRWFMHQQHMNPEEAVKASLDLQSTLSIATHHRTFRLSHESYDDPEIALRAGMHSHGVVPENFVAPENGETIIFRPT